MPATLCPHCGRRAGAGGYCDERQAELDQLASARRARDPHATIRNSARWKKVVAFCLERDGRQCTYGLEPGEKFWTGRCPVRSKLQGHHRKPLAFGGEPYDPDNVRTTCDTHNKQLDREYREEHGQEGS